MTTWKDDIEPICQKFDLAEKFDGAVQFNAEGSRAMAVVLRRMYTIIDDEIERRKQPKISFWMRCKLAMFDAYTR